MSYENVKLWFAKDNEGNIITIDQINEYNRTNAYQCPVCGSKLNPKAIESNRITPHFAHVDASKCNSESQIHFWFKHKFLEKGDKFKVISDNEREYIVENILVEQSYDVGESKYRPDVTVTTECGNTIYFEMAFTNKKQVRDYLDIWLKLSNIVVEVDIKQLMFKSEIPTFKALFYDGKCFNVKRSDAYYNTIGKYKQEKLKGNINAELKDRIRKLDWFWEDMLRYKKGEIDIDIVAMSIDSISDTEDRRLINDILNKPICIDAYKDYVNYKLNLKYEEIKSYVVDKYGVQGLQFISKEIKYELKQYRGYLGISDMVWNTTSNWNIDQQDGERYYMIWIDRNIPQNIKLIN